MTTVARMDVRTGTVRVNTAAIQSLFEPSGKVAAHARQTGRNIKMAAIIDAPARTGDLKRKHQGPYYSPVPLGGHLTVRNIADYAKYVHEGTTGPIFPTRNRLLWIRPFPHSRFPKRTGWITYINTTGGLSSIHSSAVGGRTPRHFVRGQKANPWLERAMERVVSITYHGT